MALRIAIVGCGAIVEQGHLPGAAITNGVEVTVLVDRSLARAKELATKFGIERVQTDLDNLEQLADAAIVASPPGTHLTLCQQLLEKNLHVLVEKPMAVSVAECNKMIEVSKRQDRILAVGMTRRFFPTDRFLKQLIETRLFGQLISFEIENGYDYCWPSASNFILYREQSGGGVLMGLGSHILDSLCWFLGEPESLEYMSDDYGGIESECKLDLTMRCGSKGSIELSRSRNLTNRYLFRFERCIVEAPFFGNSISLKLLDNSYSLSGKVIDLQTREIDSPTTAQVMCIQLSDFSDAIQFNKPVMASAEDVRRSIAILEQCYKSNNKYLYPGISPITLPKTSL